MLAPEPAAAHAVVVASEPAVDAVLHGQLVRIQLRFNSRIDQERSRLTLIEANGRSTPVTLDPSQGPDTLSAILDRLTPGRYRLRWQVLAIDGHITHGDIPFELAP